MWNKCVYALQNKYIMLTSTFNKKYENGIAPTHAYTILTAFEVIFNGEQIKFIQLRNPHGFSLWNGKWSNNYEGWKNKYQSLFNEINKRVITIKRENNYGIQIAGGMIFKAILYVAFLLKTTSFFDDISDIKIYYN